MASAAFRPSSSRKALLEQVSREDYGRRLNEAFAASLDSSNLSSVKKVDPLFEYGAGARLGDWADANVLQTRARGAFQVAGGVAGAVGTATLTTWSPAS